MADFTPPSKLHYCYNSVTNTTSRIKQRTNISILVVVVHLVDGGMLLRFVLILLFFFKPELQTLVAVVC
jgi:hypothetical protein